MGGLLYKDYVFVNKIGKMKLTWLLSFAILFYIVLRIILPGASATTDFLARNERGQEINLLDIMFVTVYGFFVLVFLMLVNGFTGKIVDIDGKNKIPDYIGVMPVSRSTYIASKYIFIGIASHLFVSIGCIMGITCTAFCSDGYAKDLSNMILNFVVFIMSLAILVAAVELPLFLLFGKEKAQMIKIGIWTVIAMFAIGYVMFGNLEWLSSKWNLDRWMDFLSRHTTGVMLLQSLFPPLILMVYYISYRITCHFSLGRNNA